MVRRRFTWIAGLMGRQWREGRDGGGVVVERRKRWRPIVVAAAPFLSSSAKVAVWVLVAMRCSGEVFRKRESCGWLLLGSPMCYVGCGVKTEIMSERRDVGGCCWVLLCGVLGVV